MSTPLLNAHLDFCAKEDLMLRKVLVERGYTHSLDVLGEHEKNLIQEHLEMTRTIKNEGAVAGQLLKHQLWNHQVHFELMQEALSESSTDEELALKMIDYVHQAIRHQHMIH